MNAPVMADEKKTDVPPSLAFQMKDLEGKPVDLVKYKGKVVLFVNVASKCGYTKQYEGLQKLFEKFESKGLVVVGVPCNQFGGQEAGSSKEIREFCTSKYQVTFDMLEKVDVNGDKACDLYKYLTSQQTAPLPAGKVKWNFEKFVVDRDGKVVGRFSSAVTPENNDLVALIEKALAK
jgi:glutathione peroxidase